MRLEQSCRIYGVLPSSNNVLDYRQPRDIDQSPRCIDRVDRLIEQLNMKILGEQGCRGQLVGEPRSDRAGLVITGYGSRLEFMWRSTEEYLVVFKWTCGLVEATHRRFLTMDRKQLPQSLWGNIPESYKDWPT